MEGSDSVYSSGACREIPKSYLRGCLFLLIFCKAGVYLHAHLKTDGLQLTGPQ